jgi:hypothetical protein
MRAARLILPALLAAALGGCTVMAVGGAVVGGGVALVKGGVMVGKGAVAVATYPFRDSEEEKEAKRRQALKAGQSQ